MALSMATSAFIGKMQIAPRAAVRPAARSSVSVIAMASPAKAADFRGMTVEQIDAEVAAAKRALFDLRLKRATRQEYKSSNFKFNKKKVACLLTVKREAELAEGLNKRDSRSKNKDTSLRQGAKF